MDVSGFPHQVGGHFGLLTCQGHVCKPLNQREYAFYQQMDKRLLPFTPQCCGRIKVNLCSFTDDTQEDGALLHHRIQMCTDSVVDCHQTHIGSSSNEPTDQIPPTMTFRLKKCGRVEVAEKKATNLWAGQCQSKVVQKLLKGYDKHWFIILEDVVSAYKRPCVIDLKMGTRQYGDDASAQKRLSQTQKCRQSTSEQMGIRLVGMQLFHQSTQQYSYVNKFEGRRMDRLKFYDELLRFFTTAGKLRMMQLIQRLEKLREILLKAEGFRFFSSSLLIAYDGDAIDEEDEKEEANFSLDCSGPHGTIPKISLRLIDFAHSTFSGFMEGDKAYSGVDEGYLLGMESLITFLNAILKETMMCSNNTISTAAKDTTVLSTNDSPVPIVIKMPNTTVEATSAPVVLRSPAKRKLEDDEAKRNVTLADNSKVAVLISASNGDVKNMTLQPQTEILDTTGGY
uniref:Kinase n=1 Tax=Ditylenchus dipsaci TaxID=166011 RepID=A0A915DJK0_9BILA